jgi:glycosyltransferase involved in cell wall biosynthesis
MQAEIAYILKGYPRLSETFISNEIYLLETMRLKLRIFSIKQSDENQSHGVIDKIQAPVSYLHPMTSLSSTTLISWLLVNLPAYAGDHVRLFKLRPYAYLKTMFKALWMTLRYRKSMFRLRKVFIKEFLQAGSIAIQVLEAKTIRHLHAHFCHGATTIAMFASDLSGVRYSFTAHAKDIYQHDQNPGNLLQKKIQQSEFITTCTGANQIYLAKLMGNNDSVHKIYHGLDIHRFKPDPDKFSNASEPVRIVSVGRYVEKKGFHYLLEACSLLKRRGYKFQCRVIGELGDQYLPLQQLRQLLDLEDCVALGGPITHEDLAFIYQQSDVFALPCQVLGNGDRDGIPNVLMEAMATGLAVVSTRISGIPELIDSGKDGLLVAEKRPGELADALQSLITDRQLIAQLGEQARETICQEFDARHTNQRLLQLFEACINHTDHAMTKPCLNQI